MPNTTKGLPYPDSNAPARDGAQDIQALAQAVDAKLPADSGWVVLSTAGFAGTVVDPPAYRKVGNVVYMDGNVSSVPGASFQPLCTLPAGARPRKAGNYPAGSNTTVSMAINISAAGVVSVYASGSTGAWTSLSGVSFLV